MRVPVQRNPGTRVADQQLGFARAAPIDASPIADSLRQLGSALKERQYERQKFDVNRRLMEEINALQIEQEARKRDPNRSPYDFALVNEADYAQRHQQLLNEFWQQGYDRDIVEDAELRLGTIRQGLFENSLGHQLGTLKTRAFDEADQFITATSQYVANNPDGYASAEQELRDSIGGMPDLTEAERTAKIEEGLGILRQGGGRGLAMLNPGLVIGLLDPDGRTAPMQVGGSNPLDPNNGIGPDAYQLIRDFEGFREGTYWDVNHHRTGYGSDTITTADGQVREVKRGDRVSREDAERDLIRRVDGLRQGAANRGGAGWDQLGPGAQSAVLSVAYNYGEAHNRLDPLWRAVQSGDDNAVAAVIESFAGDNNGINRERREKEAALARTITTIDPGAGSVEQAPALDSLVPPTGADGAPDAFDIASAQTGHALLDAMTGAERLQVLGWAREQQNRQTTQIKAAMDIAINNAVASIQTGEYSGPTLTEEQVLQVYGPLEGPQKWAEYEGSLQTGQVVQRIKTLNPAEITREVEALRPDPTSVSYATDLKLYNAAKQAQATVLEQREEDPAAYAMQVFPEVAAAAEQGEGAYYAALDRAYERLGIDPRYADPLPATAIERTVQDYRGMTPRQRREWVQRNFSSMGEDRFQRFVNGMEGTTAATDARIYALMRNYRGGPGEWENVYQQILEGREMIAQDAAKRPSTKVLQEQFRSEAFAAINNLNPTASRAIQEAAAALYVFNGGNPTNIDVDLYRQSLQTALGGSPPYDDTKGEVNDYTLLPPKVSATQFENWKDGLSAGDLTRLSVEGLPPVYGDLRTQVLLDDIIDQGVFVMTSPGRYMIKMASDGKPLMTRTGRPFLVNIDTRDVRR